jgi:hypothetical protein
MGIVSIFVLVEEDRLRGSLLGFQKVARAYTDEPISLPWTQGHSISQPQRDLRQLIAGDGRRIRRMAASENLELACLQFEQPCVLYGILCAKPTKAFVQGVGSLARSLPTKRPAQKCLRPISIA